MFEYMNDVSFPYVVLRNFENLPHSHEVGVHSDLDLLVYDLDHFLEIFPQAQREYPAPRVRFKMPLAETNIYLDARSIGDGYYPARFQRQIIETRELHPNGFYVPSAVMFRMALAYHACHHKNTNSYERYLGNATIPELLAALKESDIGWCAPSDHTVGSFNAYFKGATAVIEKKDASVIKKQTGYLEYGLIENEARILGVLHSRHFPRVLHIDKESIEIEDCGELLTEYNAPNDWRMQCAQILHDLKSAKVMHRDIKPDNLMVKEGIIRLIDFGWARFEDDPIDEPPSCLGLPYRPSWGWDDNFSMRKCMKELDAKLEDRFENSRH